MNRILVTFVVLSALLPFKIESHELLKLSHTSFVLLLGPKLLLKGKVEVKVPSLLPQLPMPPLQLTERGALRHIQIRSFHAGKLPQNLATKMAKAAKQLLEETFGEDTPTIDMEIVTEPNAIGSGLGILIVATTTTNCRLGGPPLCKPTQKADQAARFHIRAPPLKSLSCGIYSR